MRLTPEDLHQSDRFDLVEEVAHENLIPAVQSYLRRSSPVKALNFLVNALAFAGLGFVWVRSGVSFLEGFPNVALGMCLGYLLLLPIHESIHAMTYRSLGAEGTKVVYRLRNLTAYCVADRFVVSGREFVWVCLMPFLVLNTILVALILFLGGFRPMLWGMLILHVGACSGDLAFVNLAWHHRKDRMLTYDDVSGNRTLFFTTRSPQTNA